MLSDRREWKDGEAVPEVYSMTDYYPFGSERNSSSNGQYSFGFNGMMKDNEVKGRGRSYDFGARMYDPETGRWRSVDKIMKPFHSSYSFTRNNPIVFIDPDGNDEFHFNAKGELTKIVIKDDKVHMAYWHVSDDLMIPIKLQDQKTDHLRYRGELELSPSDLGNSDENLDELEFLQKLGPGETRDILSGKKGTLGEHHDNIFAAARNAAVCKYAGINVLRSLQNLDWGKSSLDNKTMYVFQINGKMYGMNAQNAGNFLYGITFQQFGFSKSQSAWLGEFWNLLIQGNFDSEDDQEAIKLGWQYGKENYGAPVLDRSGFLTWLKQVRSEAVPEMRKKFDVFIESLESSEESSSEEEW